MATVCWQSTNYNARTTPVSLLVLHYTGMPTAHEALERLCDPASSVSAHYLIEEDGTIHQLVAEAHRAWHAGVSAWHDLRDINSASIGIELVNKGHEWGYHDFPDAQIHALIPLCRAIIQRHGITPRNVVGHSDIAPARKQDPGERFPWRQLATEGIGWWPPAAKPTSIKTIDNATLATHLHRWGYDTTDLAAAMRAFARHYLPDSLPNPSPLQLYAILCNG